MAFLLWLSVVDFFTPNNLHLGEAPAQFAACRYAGQVANLRRIGNPPAASAMKNRL